MKVGVDTLRKATLVVAGLVVATGVPALVLTFGNGSGSAQAGSTSVHSRGHSAQQPATAAGSSDTSSTTSSTTSTTPGAPVISATTGATTSTAPTTTTILGPPPCRWAQFTVTVATTQSTPFTRGQPIQFTVTVENTGPACTDQGQEHCDCWGAYAENSSYQTTVWVWGAPGPPTSSISVSSPPPIVPTRWTTSRSMSWDQRECTNSTDCSENPAPPGTYEIVGLWADHVTQKPDASQPVSVTILPI